MKDSSNLYHFFKVYRFQYPVLDYSFGEGDGGDSAFFTGHYVTFRSLGSEVTRIFFPMLLVDETLNAPPIFLKNILDPFVQDGHVIRHPFKPFANLKGRMTRDQATPIMIACSVTGRVDLLRQIFDMHKKRMFLTLPNRLENHAKDSEQNPVVKPWWNRDITLFEFFGLYIRGFKWWPLYPLLFLSDLETCLSALVKVFWYARNVKSNDDMQTTALIIHALYRYPTPLSYLARFIYRHRPNAKVPMPTGPQSACASYFSVSPGWRPPLHKIILPVMKKFKL